MTNVGSIYGQALYDLALSEGLAAEIGKQLAVLDRCFTQETPEFLRLLGAPTLSKEERCKILDDSFRGQVQPYVLNFLKILTEKGYMRYFSDCCSTYRDCYNKDNNILPVKATTAVALTQDQVLHLKEKLGALTGKEIARTNHLEPKLLGGVRLDYDGKRLDDTIANRLDRIRGLLENTVL